MQTENILESSTQSVASPKKHKQEVRGMMNHSTFQIILGPVAKQSLC